MNGPATAAAMGIAHRVCADVGPDVVGPGVARHGVPGNVPKRAHGGATQAAPGGAPARPAAGKRVRTLQAREGFLPPLSAAAASLLLACGLILSGPAPARAQSSVSSVSSVSPVEARAAALADSLRREAGRLAAEGRLDQAQALVARHAGDMPGVWRSMFAGKLEADGEASARGYTGAAVDSAPEQMRGEAVFRLGQYHYAAGRYHLAIPQFRTYLSRYPDGMWSQESAYWMAHACLQLVKQQPARVAYLDTALVYLRRIEAKGPKAYYWPLARAAQARVHLARSGVGDTAAAIRALQGAHGRMPPEETPGLLLLSLHTQPDGVRAAAWEDSLRWTYPLSPETRSLPPSAAREPPAASPRPSPPSSSPISTSPSTPARGTHMLQLGAFAQLDNAQRLRADLAAKNITTRIEPLRSGNRTLHRVVMGDYPDAATAQQEGKRLLDRLGYSFRVVAKE